MQTASAVVLGAVFLASGALKIRDPSWPEAARVLGAPSFIIPVIAPLELGLGALLVVGLARGPAAIASLGLLVAFTVMLVKAIRAGDRPVCACFGVFSARPIGIWSVVRNVVLLILAAVAGA